MYIINNYAPIAILWVQCTFIFVNGRKVANIKLRICSPPGQLLYPISKTFFC